MSMRYFMHWVPPEQGLELLTGPLTSAGCTASQQQLP